MRETGGLSAKGRAKFKREQGSNLKPPVTTKPSKLKEEVKAAKGARVSVRGQGDLSEPMELIVKKQEPQEEDGIVDICLIIAGTAIQHKKFIHSVFVMNAGLNAENQKPCK